MITGDSNVPLGVLVCLGCTDAFQLKAVGQRLQKTPVTLNRMDDRCLTGNGDCVHGDETDTIHDPRLIDNHPFLWRFDWMVQ